MVTRLVSGISLALLVLLAAAQASALSFTLQVLENGGPANAMDQTMMNCGGITPSYNCAGINAALGNLGIDSWNFTLDEDPIVSGTVSVTNNNSVLTHYTMIFTLATTVPITPTSLIGGSMQGGASDNNGDGVTLATFAGSSLYAALIDGATVQTLYGDPAAFSAGAFLSTNVPSLAFGTPIPSQPGPAVNSSIGIIFDFTLTPGDSASFTGNFVALVPEPGTALLLAMGLSGLALHGRRSGRNAPRR